MRFSFYVFFTFWTFLATDLLACSCAFRPIEERVKDVDFVAKGRIMLLEHHESSFNGASAKLRAEKIFKGSEYKAKLDELVSFSMPAFTLGSAACAYEFLLGGEYLVFAREQLVGEGRAVLHTNLCFQNSEKSQAEYTKDLAWLESQD